jgi:hypothetical protein
MRSVVRMAAVLGLVLAACGSDDGQVQEQPVEQPDTETGGARATPLVINPIHDAQVVRGDDGMDHVVYQLLVVSVFNEPITLTSVGVLDPDGNELLRIEGEALAATTQTLLDKTPSAVVPGSGAVGIGVNVIVPPDTAPDTLTHHITYTLEQDSTNAPMVDRPEIDGPEVAVDHAAAVELDPPVQGEGWLSAAACCSPNVHFDLRVGVDGRRIETPETFAIDFARVRGDRVYDGDGSSNDQYYNYGAEVLAVADATVVFIQDGKEDQEPGTAMVPKDATDYGGNQVMLQLDDDLYAWYAHLQPGSITVKAGDEVETGEVLAKLGNTGPSLGPHLHFGLLDQPSSTTGRGIPFVFEEYTHTGTIDMTTVSGDTLQITPQDQQIELAYPLYGSIATYP